VAFFGSFFGHAKNEQQTMLPSHGAMTPKAP